MSKQQPLMKAAFIEAPGPPEAISYSDLPIPTVGPDEALVRVEAVVVNPVDTYIRSGQYKVAMPLPFIIGRDLVGVVTATGAHVSSFAPGDRVWTNSLGYGGRQGSFAEYVCVEEQRLYPLPDGVDPVDAVAVFHLAATAFTGLIHHAQVQPGDVLFINGGAGNVGSAVLQVARGLGARVIVTASGAEDMAWCQRWGAERVIDYKHADLEAELHSAALEGITIYWDTTGHHDLDRAVRVLAPRGRIVIMAGLAERPAFPIGPFYTKDARMVGFVITNARLDELAEAATAINRMLASQALAAQVTQILPLSEAAEAHRLVEGTPTRAPIRGRLVLRPDRAR
jgi:NADPH:quinone reductase-like Zn-dependent oxidoreductase